MLTITHLTKSYYRGQQALQALYDINLDISSGVSLSVVGPSGSGKSTLLGLCAGLDRPSSGKIFVHDVDITTLSEDDLARFRGENIGFVFQSFELIPSLTALENVMLPAELQKKSRATDIAQDLLDFFGLSERMSHYPAELSGGEQQRVAIARAFVNRPKLLFGDEPTGNLDGESAAQVIEELFRINKEFSTTLVLATHDETLARLATRQIQLASGKIINVPLEKREP